MLIPSLFGAVCALVDLPPKLIVIVLCAVSTMSSAGTKPVKPNKKKKDPNAPKRPRSAYIIYCNDMREEVKKANPNAKHADFMQLVGQMWSNLSPNRKQEYNDKASTSSLDSEPRWEDS